MTAQELRDLAKWLEEQASIDASDGMPNDAEKHNKAARVVADQAELLGVLKLMFDSAYPHPVEHPTMFKAWGEARILLVRHGVIALGDIEGAK